MGYELLAVRKIAIESRTEARTRVHVLLCRRQEGDAVRECNSRTQQEHGRRNNSTELVWKTHGNPPPLEYSAILFGLARRPPSPRITRPAKPHISTCVAGAKKSLLATNVFEVKAGTLYEYYLRAICRCTNGLFGSLRSQCCHRSRRF